jgi:hypothetical protein
MVNVRVRAGSKAADLGYKLIVVLSGIQRTALSALRKLG